jgi:hypothetical protein
MTRNIEKFLRDVYDMRQYIRFDSDTQTIGNIFLSLCNRDIDLSMSIKGIAMNESYLGCCLLLNEIKELEVGNFCKIIIGNLGPYIAQVRWIKESKEGFHVGFCYLE